MNANATKITRRTVAKGHAERKAEPRTPATYRDPQLHAAYAAKPKAAKVSYAEALAAINDLF